MNVATATASQWKVSARIRGEVLATQAVGQGLFLGLLGAPAGFTPAEIEGWLNDLIGVARETRRDDTGEQPIPVLLHHALTGLLFSHEQLWERPGELAPCSFAFAAGEGRTGFGWVGEAAVRVWMDGEPIEPSWLLVRNDEGRQARAWVAEGARRLQIHLLWSASEQLASGAAAVIEAEWAGGAPDAAAPPGAAATPDAIPLEQPALGAFKAPAAGALPVLDAEDVEADAAAAGSESTPPGLESAPPRPGLPSASGEWEVFPVARRPALAGSERIGPPVDAQRSSPPEAAPPSAEPVSTVSPAGVPPQPPGPAAPPPAARPATPAWRDETDPRVARVHQPPAAKEGASPAPPQGQGLAGEPIAAEDRIEEIEVTAASALVEDPLAQAAEEGPGAEVEAAAEPRQPSVVRSWLRRMMFWRNSAAAPAAIGSSSPEDEVVAPEALEPEANAPAAAADPLEVAAPNAEEHGREGAPGMTPPAASQMPPPASAPAPEIAAAPAQVMSPPVSERGSEGASGVAPPPASAAAPEIAAAPAQAMTPPAGAAEPARRGPTAQQPRLPRSRVDEITPEEEMRPLALERARAEVETRRAALESVTGEGEDATAGAARQPIRRARRLELPSEVEPEVMPVWRRPWAWGVVVAALFFGGWLVGSLQGGGTPGSAATRLLRGLGLGGARFDVTVNSKPPGAWIAVDGRDLARRTPAAVELTPGSHELKLSFSDLGAATFTVQGQRGERVALDAPLWGSLRVYASESAPPVTVALDGRSLGVAPVAVDDLAPGTHQLDFSSPGIEPWGQTVQVRVREAEQLIARPVTSPATGVIEVRATFTADQGAEALEGAQVWVDGQLRGRTPLTLELSRGPHSIRVRGRGEDSPVQVIDLPGGNQRFATFDLGVTPDPLNLVSLVPPLAVPLDRPALFAASLENASAGEVREMWLHVRGAEGAWRRYQMAMLKAPGGVAGVAIFPVASFDPDGRSRYYMSALTQTGDEYFTEIAIAEAVRAAPSRAAR